MMDDTQADQLAKRAGKETNQWLWEVAHEVQLTLRNADNVPNHVYHEVDRFLNLVGGHFDELRMEARRKVDAEFIEQGSKLQ